MLTAIEAIYDRLKDDTTLTTMLASNKPFNDSRGTADGVNSILPMGIADGKTLKPFISIQDGVANLTGEKRLVSSTFYIRVYNSPDKTFVQINQIADRVVELIHLYDFNLEDGVHVETKFESALQSATDQAMNLNFRELRFAMLVL